MSEILKPQLQNIFNSHNFSSSQSYIPSLGTAFQSRLTSTLQDRTSNYSSNVKYENPYTRPLLSNTSSAGSYLSLASSIPTTKRQIFSPMPQNNVQTYLPKAPFLPEKAPQHQHLKTLVLDLDETLIHASVTPISRPDHIVRLSDGTRFYVLKRPYLDEFLAQMSKLYELVILTAGEGEYATAVINQVDTGRHISYVLHRSHCTLPNSRKIIKDLSLLGRDLKDIVFIDNLEENFAKQRDNGLKILDFYSNKADEELKKFISFLEHVSQLDDVRPIRKLHANYLAKGIQIQPRRNTIFGTQSNQKLPNGWADMTYVAEDSTTNTTIDGVQDKLNQTALDFGHEGVSYHFSTPLKRDSHKRNEGYLSTSQIISPVKNTTKAPLPKGFEEKMKQLKHDYHNRTASTTQQFQKTSTQSSSSKSNLFGNNTQQKNERVKLEKETLVFGRVRETGMYIESSSKFVVKTEKFATNTTASTEGTLVLDELYQRINALEQKIKAKNFKPSQY